MPENELVLEKKPFYQRAKDYLRKKRKALVTTPLIVGSLVAGSFFVKPPSLEAQVQNYMKGRPVTVVGTVVEKDDYINRDIDAVLEVTVVQDENKTTEYNNPIRVLIHEDYIRGSNGNGEALKDTRSLLNSGDFLVQVDGIYATNNPEYKFIIDPEVISFIEPGENGAIFASIDTNADTQNMFKTYNADTRFQLYTVPPFGISPFWSRWDSDLDGIPDAYDYYPNSYDWNWGLGWNVWLGSPVILWSPWGDSWGLWGWNNHWHHHNWWNNHWGGWNMDNYYINNYYNTNPNTIRTERPKFVISKNQLQAPRNAVGKFSLAKGEAGLDAKINTLYRGNLQDRGTLDKGRLIRPTQGQIKKYGTSTRNTGTVRNIRKRSTTSATRARTGTASRGTVTKRTTTRRTVRKTTPPRTIRKTSPPRTRRGTTTKTKIKKKKDDESAAYLPSRTYSSDPNISKYSGDRRTYTPTSIRNRAIIRDTIKRQQERIVPYQRTIPTTPSRTTQKRTTTYQPKKYTPPTYQKRQTTNTKRTTTPRVYSRSSRVSRAPTRRTTSSRSTVRRSTPTRSTASRSRATRSRASRSSSSSRSRGSSSSRVKKK